MKQGHNIITTTMKSAAIKRGIGYAAFPLVVLSISSIGSAVAQSSKATIEVQSSPIASTVNVSPSQVDISTEPDNQNETSQNISTVMSNVDGDMNVEVNGQPVEMPSSGSSNQTISTDAGPVNVQMSQSITGEASNSSHSSTSVRIRSSSSTRTDNGTERSSTNIRMTSTE